MGSIAPYLGGQQPGTQMLGTQMLGTQMLGTQTLPPTRSGIRIRREDGRAGTGRRRDAHNDTAETKVSVILSDHGRLHTAT